MNGKYVSACTIPPQHYSQRACRADELSFEVSFSGGGYIGGGAEAGLELRTIGSEPCVVTGVPHLAIWDRYGHTVGNTR